MGGLWDINLEFTGLGFRHLDLCQRGTESDIASPMVQGKIPGISKGPQSGATRDLVGLIPLGAGFIPHPEENHGYSIMHQRHSMLFRHSNASVSALN